MCWCGPRCCVPLASWRMVPMPLTQLFTSIQFTFPGNRQHKQQAKKCTMRVREWPNSFRLIWKKSLSLSFPIFSISNGMSMDVLSLASQFERRLRRRLRLQQQQQQQLQVQNQTEPKRTRKQKVASIHQYAGSLTLIFRLKNLKATLFFLHAIE